MAKPIKIQAIMILIIHIKIFANTLRNSYDFELSTLNVFSLDFNFSFLVVLSELSFSFFSFVVTMFILVSY